MRLWNGYRWIEYEPPLVLGQPIMFEEETDAGLVVGHYVPLVRRPETERLSGVTLQQGPGDREQFIDDLVQTAASLCPGVEYDDEDHAKGLPDE